MGKETMEEKITSKEMQFTSKEAKLSSKDKTIPKVKKVASHDSKSKIKGKYVPSEIDQGSPYCHDKVDIGIDPDEEETTPMDNSLDSEQGSSASKDKTIPSKGKKA